MFPFSMRRSSYKPTLPQIQSGFDLISLSSEAPTQDASSVSHGPDSARSYVSSNDSTVPGSEAEFSAPRFRSLSSSVYAPLGARGPSPPKSPELVDRSTPSSRCDSPLQCSTARVRLHSDSWLLPPPTSSLESGVGCSLDSVLLPGSKRTSTCTSVASSYHLYGEPSQTLIFLDWDDTLFPTYELFDRRGIDKAATDCPEDLNSDPVFLKWREALQQFLCDVLENSDMCVIVTNSKRPWVDRCIDRFVPELRALFDQNKGRLQVVYADESVRAREAANAAGHARSSRASIGSGCMCYAVVGLLNFLQAAWENSDADLDDQDYAAAARELTTAKRVAMEQAAVQFYSRYLGQTWKNILSFGDMPYEYDALRDLSDGRKATMLQRAQQKLHAVRAKRRRQERLRTKALIVPGAPTLEELTLQLHLTRRLLPAFVRYDGDVDVDMRSDQEPMQSIAQAVNIPQLADVRLPWQSEERDEEINADRALEEVDMVVQLAVHSWMQEVCESQRVPSRC